MFTVQVYHAANGWAIYPTLFKAQDEAQRAADAIELERNVLARVVDMRPPSPGRAKGYYVTFRDGAKTCWAVGPFAAHATALDMVKRVADKLYELKPESHFWSRGTTSREADSWGELPKGVLNKIFTIFLDNDAI